MHAVFLDKQTFSSSIDFNAIEREVTKLSCYNMTQTEQVIERCLDAEIIITNKVLLTNEVLKQLPKLKLICIAATGTNNVDINAAKSLNIAVTNVSGYAGTSVAQYVFAQILSYYQQIEHHNNNTALGLWSSSETFCYHGNAIAELAGKSLGIVGYGNLGQAVEQIAKAFQMRVLISERPNAKSIRANRLSFEQVVQQADILSLHCPQTPDTEKVINEEVLKQMKASAMLINTARGALIDNNALLLALQSKQIAFAALDVLEQEPPPANHLLLNTNLSNLKVTAHIAWASSEAQQRLINLLAKNITSFKSGTVLNRVDLET
ncbi:D-2-hydroxyacid dehydrogenase [Litorilituus lipolyticus]|uniref:D-2-hydroxyacid dehydrogenase n=1 Tax=Litorilituus lipolyticus TaxID=2491017 RepID=A0A502KTU2_9GAMM|nr:D-2-hydroxyacid dehydrogenase [Litorilituus lipolyticus]TPH15028.1 D-2-hydroxyacid dehydrogenase [Litorilituus lipolyticus]